jgi:hypothetical protein
MLFYFDCSKLIKFNWEPLATPVARQEEGSSAHRASVAGLPRHYMWRGKVDLPRHVGRRGQTG